MKKPWYKKDIIFYPLIMVISAGTYLLVNLIASKDTIANSKTLVRASKKLKIDDSILQLKSIIKKYLLILAVSFHVLIIFYHGIFSFFFAITAPDYWPDNITHFVNLFILSGLMAKGRLYTIDANKPALNLQRLKRIF